MLGFLQGACLHVGSTSMNVERHAWGFIGGVCNALRRVDCSCRCLVAQSCPTLCDLMDCTHTGSAGCSWTEAERQAESQDECLREREKAKNYSVDQSCPTLYSPMDHSMPGLPVLHRLPELAQTHVHHVGDATQPSHPLSSPSPPAFNLSQHQGLFQ